MSKQHPGKLLKTFLQFKQITDSNFKKMCNIDEWYFELLLKGEGTLTDNMIVRLQESIPDTNWSNIQMLFNKAVKYYINSRKVR